MGIDLLSTVEKGGCSSKIPASILEIALSKMPRLNDPNILVDIDTHDDAGVYKINEELAIIFTTDFFPPICSDPYEFGQIAAANSLSDVYAMGGEPFLALNIVLFPNSKIPLEVLSEILKGAAKVAEESGTIIIGGHTIDDHTPKFGLAVIGRIHPKKIITNAGLTPGEMLILTKPLGTGVLTTAKKLNLVDDVYIRESIQWMKMLNKGGAEVMQQVGVKGATDVTGFGLIGHALKMAKASRVDIKINSKDIPILKGVYDLVDSGCIPTATFDNYRYAINNTKYTVDDYNIKMILNDAQTSGGIIMGVKPENTDSAIKLLKSKGYTYAKVIGEVYSGDGNILVE